MKLIMNETEGKGLILIMHGDEYRHLFDREIEVGKYIDFNEASSVDRVTSEAIAQMGKQDDEEEVVL